jgi:glyoxylase-like metal-dependent hydrolase (beta-lactamase superfamily II)
LTRLHVVSGTGGKAAACFLVESAGHRILLDLGREPGSGGSPDLTPWGRIDAVLLSHGHDDHVGALDLLPRIGSPPVHATEPVAAGLPGGLEVRHLPVRGEIEVGATRVATGRNGHAPGGIWLHLATPEGGLFYAGDMCWESAIYAIDPAPPARIAVLDGSYGLDDTPQAARRQALASLLDGRPVLLPAPPRGRGPELALFAKEVTGRLPALCEATRHAVHDLLGVARACLRDGAEAPLRALLDAPPIPDEPEGVMVAANADASGGAAAAAVARWRGRAELLIVFTGHVPAGTPAARLLEESRALWRRWNVHPRLSHNTKLAREIGARVVLPAFTDAPLAALAAAFAPAQLVAEDPIDL